MKTEASQKEHQWLEQLVGEWTYEAEMPENPNNLEEKFTGTESVSLLGGLWILAKGQADGNDDVPAATMLMTVGYDSRQQRFVGTWIGSMMSYLWIYDGELSADGKTLSLYSTGPAMNGNGEAKYRDAIRIEDPDNRSMTASVLDEAGNWKTFMITRYRRRR